MEPRTVRPWQLALATLGALALALVLAFNTSTHHPPAPPSLDRDGVLLAFASPDPDEVRAALAHIREVKPPPVDWLLSLLRHENRGVREWSTHAMGDIAPQRKDVVDALVVSFQDDDDYVRWKAARALGNIGPLAAVALPMLERTANTEPDQEVEVVRATAIKAVGQIKSSP